MVDFLFTLGQAASMLLMICGAALALTPTKRRPDARQQDEMRLMYLRIQA
jgi:hypothetical protein